MAKKKQAGGPTDKPVTAPSSSINDIKLSIQSDSKNVQVHISNPADCAAAAEGSADGDLLADLVTFCEDILESNDDASKLDITPENAEEVLTSKQAVATPPADPDDSGDGADGAGGDDVDDINT
jgi:hypothetical protein